MIKAACSCVLEVRERDMWHEDVCFVTRKCGTCWRNKSVMCVEVRERDVC